MFAPNWSAKVEYNYIDFGDKSLAVSGPAGATLESLRQEVQVVKVGINYRFAGWPGSGPWR
jgi:outer membrane immunogenic protein